MDKFFCYCEMSPCKIIQLQIPKATAVLVNLNIVLFKQKKV